MSTFCLIIPCFNEEKRLDVQAYLSFARENGNIHLCFVDDGSSDRTWLILQNLEEELPGQIEILSLEKNQGKAEAVRSGILFMYENKAFKGDYFGYADADLATPLDQFLYLIDQSIQPKHKFILGSRIKRLGADIDRNPIRHYFGRIFSTFASLILGLAVYDTQCGAKLIHRDWIEALFRNPFLSRWIFDLELFARAIQHTDYQTVYDQVMEVPLLRWKEKGETKLKFGDFLKTPSELIRLKRHYKLKK